MNQCVNEKKFPDKDIEQEMKTKLAVDASVFAHNGQKEVLKIYDPSDIEEESIQEVTHVLPEPNEDDLIFLKNSFCEPKTKVKDILR